MAEVTVAQKTVLKALSAKTLILERERLSAALHAANVELTLLRRVLAIPDGVSAVEVIAQRTSGSRWLV